MKIVLNKLLLACALLTFSVHQMCALSVTEYVQQHGLPKIGRTLDFSNTGLTSLDGLRQVLSPGIRHLNLSNNRLTEIPHNVFDNAINLETLDLSNNQVSRLPHGIFANTPRLRQLNIINNRLAPDFIETFISMVRSMPHLELLNGKLVDQALIELLPPTLQSSLIKYLMQNLQPEQFDELAVVNPTIFNLLPLSQAQQQEILDRVAAQQPAQQ